MTEMKIDFDAVVEALISGQSVGLDLELQEFIELSEKAGQKKIRWIVVVLLESAEAQPIGYPNFTATITKHGKGILRGEDFSSVAGKILGRTIGSYTVANFFKEVLDTNSRVLFSLVLTALFVLFFWFPNESVAKDVSGAVLSSASIFVSLMGFYILNIDKSVYWKFVASGRYHVLAKSDKFIGMISILSVVFSICSITISSYGSGLDHYYSWPLCFHVNWVRLVTAIAVSIATSSLLLSVWLLLTYHVERKHELDQMEMTKLLFEEVQRREVDKPNNPKTV